ncbi:MAG: bifunctional diguanylate cyclase/phosphodiesterase [Desulfococcaceae bacterium]|jgi:diguanylate cyclase (GGDEF)-like protein|nr:bifunctional diguanylate cyclase/phosphodiesterase [Desulfococcaceae bacterium]
MNCITDSEIVCNTELIKQMPGSRWTARLRKSDFAFQPVVNIHTGVCYGYEALLRNIDTAGFQNIDDFFDCAYREGLLYPVEIILREIAIAKFSKLQWKDHVRLFFNLDNRVLNAGEYQPGNTLKILEKYGLSQDTVCFEISEKHEMMNSETEVGILRAYRSQGFKIAVDDCGSGFAGLKLLYYTRPDFIKIDRFFIQDITHDPNKKLFVSSIVNLAHVMGSIVIAEGVETEQEYFSCRNIGCDLIQGYLVQHPEQDMRLLKKTYEHIRVLSEKDQRRDQAGDEKLLDTEIEYIDAVENHSDAFQVFEQFKTGNSKGFFPVVNSNGEPLGIVSERSFKEYAYSRYGAQLLQNPSFGKNLNKFILPFPIADIRTPVEKILEIFSQNENMEGIIISDHLKYKGFLSARSLLKVLNEKNIAIARDQNPLTRLPGNTMINEFISKAVQDRQSAYILVYFDFDHFKPYNDRYGFRNGDRVILLFSDMLKNASQNAGRFAAHIGGDDFFMGIKDADLEKTVSDIRKLAEHFRNDVESFYDSESIEKGYMTAKDRNSGKDRRYPLLSVSSAILELTACRPFVYSSEEISNHMAKLKKTAKSCPDRICIDRIGKKKWLSRGLN